MPKGSSAITRSESSHQTRRPQHSLFRRNEKASHTSLTRSLTSSSVPALSLFIQTYGKYAWQVAPGTPIDLTAARSADSIAQEQLDSGFHRSRWNRATPAERRYLAALADLGDGPRPTADVSARLGSTQNKNAVQRQNLIDVEGLVYSRREG